MSKSFASLTGSMLARRTALRAAADLPLAGSNDAEWSPVAIAPGNPPVPAATVAATAPAIVAAPAEPLLASKQAPLAKVVPLVRPAADGGAAVPVRPTGLRPLPVRRTRPAAFTLRLDPDRHLRLRLACTLQGRSAQALVTAAVDRLIAELPEIEPLADRISTETIVRPLWDNQP